MPLARSQLEPVDFGSLECAFESLFAASMAFSAMARVAVATLLAVCCAVRHGEYENDSGSAATIEPQLTLKEHWGNGFDETDNDILSKAIPKCWEKVKPTPANVGYAVKLVKCIMDKYRDKRTGEQHMVISAGPILGHDVESKGFAIYNYQNHDILFWDDSA
eukprot:s1617_g3.t1